MLSSARSYALKKNKKRREKPLFNNIKIKGNGKAIFFNSNKIQRARER